MKEGSIMNCSVHLDREATGTCTYCGNFFCSDCLVNVKGRNYCREHVGEAVSNSQAAQQPNIIINNSNSNVNANTNTNVNTNTNGATGYQVSQKSRLVSLLLCFFFGVFGIHRFYVGKIGTGILWFLTFGCFGIGVTIDLLIIILGSFRDKFGLQVKNW